MIVVKNLVSKEMSLFLAEYIRVYKNAITYMFQSKFITEELKDLGTYKDRQALGTFSQYSNRAIETLAKVLKPKMEKELNKSLVESFTYLRAYKTGDELLKHKDVGACEIACTIHLGKDAWDIYVEDKKVALDIGDGLIYNGVEELHWRNKFEGEECIQIMIFYLDASRKDIDKQKYDGRPCIGLPSYFNNREPIEGDY